MGQTLSEPVTAKESAYCQNDEFQVRSIRHTTKPLCACRLIALFLLIAQCPVITCSTSIVTCLDRRFTAPPCHVNANRKPIPI